MATTRPRWTVPVIQLSFLLAVSVATAIASAQEPGPVRGGARDAKAAGRAEKNLLVVVIAGAFVAIYWLDRFNVPERKKPGGPTEKERFRLPATNRSSTTASRYYSAAAAYCAIGLGLYVLLVFSAEAWRHLAEAVELGIGGDLPPWLNEAASPFAVALALTVLVPKVPGFKQGDAWLRGRFHYYAAIPDEVRRLSRQLRASDDPAVETHTFAAPERARTAVRKGLEEELVEDVKAGVDLDQWVLFEPAVGSRDLASRWTKAEVLMRQVRTWEADEGLRRFVARHSDTVDALHARRSALLTRMRELMRVSRGITSGEGAQALAAYRKVLAEDAREFLHDLYDFVSAAVLSRHRMRSRISEDLARLGFHVEWHPLRLTIHEFALAGILGFLVMIVGFLLATVPSSRMTIGHALAVSFLVGCASAGAVLSAILPRDKGWAIARRRASNRAAWAYYVTSGSLAFALQIPFSWMFRLARERDLQSAWEMFWARDVGGWLWMSFALAAGLAALIDRDHPIGHAWLGRAACLGEGLLLGAGSGFTGLLIALLLGQARAPLGPVVAMLAVLGVVLGVSVPSMYRDAPRTRNDALTEGAPTPTRGERELVAGADSAMS